MKLEDIAARIDTVPLQNGQKLVAIVGAPASGKSTFAQALHGVIPGSCVVPMDGFHRDNDDLERHGLLARKGAPATFDVAGFAATIATLRAKGEVSYPTFDRNRDCVVPNGGAVSRSDSTILVEGNYLLLGSAPWDALSDLWDFSIRLDVPLDVIRARLIERWLHYGHDLESATARAESNDLPNAMTIARSSHMADLTLTDWQT